jgi:hypothetical protein
LAPVAVAGVLAATEQAKSFNDGSGCSQACGALNVKDSAFGAKGDGRTDDTTAIQACFNQAFGTTESPHGTNGTQNMGVYFPAGRYKIARTLQLKQVLGGHIFGDGASASILQWGGGAPRVATNMLNINGMQHTKFEQLGFDGNGVRTNNLTLINLDWDNTGSVKLNTNIFDTLSFGNVNGSAPNFAIAASGNDGRSNTFFACEIIGAVGVKIIGASATNQAFLDCSGEGNPSIWAAGGSIGSIVDGQFVTGINGTGVQIDSGDCVIIGSRSEESVGGLTGWSWVTITAGSVALYSCTFSGSGTSGSGYLKMSGTSRALLDTCDDAGSINGKVSGTSNTVLEIRAAKFTGLANPGQNISGFNGTLTRWRLPPSTFANLPTAKTGMEQIVTDATVNTFGANISAGGGGKSVLARYNGANWTVMGA